MHPSSEMNGSESWLKLLFTFCSSSKSKTNYPAIHTTLTGASSVSCSLVRGVDGPPAPGAGLWEARVAHAAELASTVLLPLPGFGYKGNAEGSVRTEARLGHWLSLVNHSLLCE